VAFILKVGNLLNKVTDLLEIPQTIAETRIVALFAGIWYYVYKQKNLF
jgi:hypothetical protein